MNIRPRPTLIVGCLARAVLSSLLVAAPAYGEPQPVSLQYSAGTECPDADFFVREVSARTPHALFQQGSSVGRLFNVSVRGSPGDYSGDLTVVDGTGDSAVRTFAAEACTDVVAAVALVAALVIDPNASTASGIAATHPAPDALHEMPAPKLPDDRATTADVLADSGSERAEQVGNRWWYAGAGATAQLVTGMTPVPFGAIGLFVALERDGQLVAPLFRLGGYFAQTGIIGPEHDKAMFLALVARVEGCPIILRISGEIGLRPCLGVEGGSMNVVGDGSVVPRPKSADALWASGTVSMGLSVLLSENWFAEAQAAAALAITRPAYVFENPEQLVYMVPPLGARLGMAVGMRFP